IGAALVTAVCTFGASTALTTWVGVGGAVLSAAVGVAQAKARKDAADTMAEADTLGMKAEQFAKLAQERQKDIEAKQELLKLIMEAKAGIIQAVLQMLNNKFATSARVTAIATAR